ncbi:MAG: hypothetical protein VR64_14380 [Desulfatitalea sp. BRH_c12]|nr:MAG: hypothetical protein VR64_14380 [Desulfatitalea sp. BRH_c12]
MTKIVMITESPYPEDTRIKNEATTLVKAGYSVTVIALNFNARPFQETLHGVRVYRLPMITLFAKSSSKKNWLDFLLYRIKSSLGYILEYVYFTVTGFFLSHYVNLKYGADVVHIHNPPNTLFVIGLSFKLLGKRYVFDHHDLAPELYLSKYQVSQDLLYKLLLIEEKMSLKLADMVVATNQSYKEIDARRAGIDPEKIVIVRNGPDPARFQPVAPDVQLKSMGKTILAYLGIMGPQDGVDYMLRALHHLAYELHRRDFFCVIVGPGDALDDLRGLATSLGLDDYVRFTGFIPKADLLRYLSSADICLDPNPSSPLNDVSTWIKVMEYMALSKPVISFDLRETRFSAQEAAVYVVPNDTHAYARAIADLMDDREKRERMGRFGRQRVEHELAWEYSAHHLVLAYAKLFGKALAAPPAVARVNRGIQTKG